MLRKRVRWMLTVVWASNFSLMALSWWSHKNVTSTNRVEYVNYSESYILCRAVMRMYHLTLSCTYRGGDYKTYDWMVKWWVWLTSHYTGVRWCSVSVVGEAWHLAGMPEMKNGPAKAGATGPVPPALQLVRFMSTDRSLWAREWHNWRNHIWSSRLSEMEIREKKWQD